MKILDARRVREDLFDRLAGQSHQRRLPSRRTPFLLRRRRGAHAKPTPLVRFLARHGRRKRSDVDTDVFGNARRSLQKRGDPLWRQVRRERRPELLEIRRDGPPALADVRDRDPVGRVPWTRERPRLDRLRSVESVGGVPEPCAEDEDGLEDLHWEGDGCIVCVCR